MRPSPENISDCSSTSQRGLFPTNGSPVCSHSTWRRATAVLYTLIKSAIAACSCRLNRKPPLRVSLMGCFVATELTAIGVIAVRRHEIVVSCYGWCSVCRRVPKEAIVTSRCMFCLPRSGRFGLTEHSNQVKNTMLTTFFTMASQTPTNPTKIQHYPNNSISKPTQIIF